jgi:hypothetical protein
MPAAYVPGLQDAIPGEAVHPGDSRPPIRDDRQATRAHGTRDDSRSAKEAAMRGASRSKGTSRITRTGTTAAVWIEPDRALVVRGGDGAEHASFEVPLPALAASLPPALAEIAHSIGPVDRVLVLGPDDLRTALEREIVAIGHRPDTIREARPDGPLDEAYLVSRLRHLR